jgi:hypothetical protein
MNTILPVATLALLVLGGVANAKQVCLDAHELHAMAASVKARHTQPAMASNPLQWDNPTGLPAYEMRPDGLMINGLLPANGWQG